MNDLEVQGLRMYLIVRGDLDEVSNGALNAGKLMGQAGHAFSGALFQIRDAVLPNGKSVANQYFQDNSTKIVVKCKNLAALDRAEIECRALGLNICSVTDAAHTVFASPTKTCVAVGPCYRNQLPKFVQKMQLY
jgi:peptidyl-tRNA hydrolase